MPTTHTNLYQEEGRDSMTVPYSTASAPGALLPFLGLAL